jgi:predicted Zn-dependent peptidase
MFLTATRHPHPHPTPRLADWEVNDMLHKVEEDLEDAYSNPSVLAHELLHKAAFTGGLSNALLPDPANLYSLSGDVLREFVSSAFTAGNIAVTAAGVNLVQLQQVCARGPAGVC